MGSVCGGGAVMKREDKMVLWTVLVMAILLGHWWLHQGGAWKEGREEGWAKRWEKGTVESPGYSFRSQWTTVGKGPGTDDGWWRDLPLWRGLATVIPAVNMNRSRIAPEMAFLHLPINWLATFLQFHRQKTQRQTTIGQSLIHDKDQPAILLKNWCFF